MTSPTIKFTIEDYIRATLKARGFRKTGNLNDYERAKEIIRAYYSEYYAIGVKIASDMIGV